MSKGKSPIPAVAAVVVKDGKILLVKRRTEPSKGLWSVPGGKVEQDETLTEAVVREVREETGLEIEVDGVAGVFELKATVEGLPEFHYTIVDYFAHPVGGELMPGDDAEEIRWVSLEELDDYELT